MLEKERCQQCGYPRYVCHNNDEDIDFRVVEEVCQATVKKEAHEQRERERREKRKGAKEPSGVSVNVEAYTYSGREFSVFRDSFYEDMEKKRTARDDEIPRPPA